MVHSEPFLVVKQTLEQSYPILFALPSADPSCPPFSLFLSITPIGLSFSRSSCLKDAGETVVDFELVENEKLD